MVGHDHHLLAIGRVDPMIALEAGTAARSLDTGADPVRPPPNTTTPGVPDGWRNTQDAAELPPWSPAAARADQVEDLDDDDDDEASVLDGRIVDGFEPPWYSSAALQDILGRRRP